MSKQICGAKKRNGGVCQQPAMDNGRCRLHGGKTPKGIASPNFKTGRHSKYLPTALLERYGEALEDGELLNMRAEIALLDTLLLENLGRLETGESADFWDAALTQVVNARLAYKSENYGALEKSLDELEALCDGRRLHYATEKEIREKLDQRKRLADSERKRLVDMQQMVTSEQAMALVSALLASIQKNVHDRNTLSAIQTEFMALVNRPDYQRIGRADTEEE
jgi:hypothetical protein